MHDLQYMHVTCYNRHQIFRYVVLADTIQGFVGWIDRRCMDGWAVVQQARLFSEDIESENQAAAELVTDEPYTDPLSCRMVVRGCPRRVIPITMSFARCMCGRPPPSPGPAAPPWTWT